MFNMGAIIDLPSEDWFGDFPTSLTVHVIDSSRPQNLASVFGTGENGDRIIIWDDGGVEDLQEERKAWEVLTVCLNCAAIRDLTYGCVCSMHLKRTPMRRTPTRTLTRRQKRMRKMTRMRKGMKGTTRLLPGNGGH